MWKDFPNLVALQMADEVPSCSLGNIRLTHGSLPFEVLVDLRTDLLKVLDSTFSQIDMAHVDQFTNLIHGGIFRHSHKMNPFMGSSRSGLGFIYSATDIVVTLAC